MLRVNIVLFVFLCLLIGKAPTNRLHARRNKSTQAQGAVTSSFKVMWAQAGAERAVLPLPALAACARVLSVPLVWLPTQPDYLAFL